ncbi:MAG: hypothetical protein IJQ56_11385, partial [Synergistaceae bacterium]|nr:hypothetical protein [Synergistaceae bacterium]
MRIFAMLMIIAFHFYFHGGFDFPVNSISFNRLVFQFFNTFGCVGNEIFVLISGYFLIKSSGIRLSKVINMWLKMFFYSLSI